MRMKASRVLIDNIESLIDGYSHAINQGGTRSTKTHSKVQEYILLATIRKNTELFMVGKTNRIIKLTLYKYLKKILGGDFRKFGKYLKSENTYYFHNGSAITFISAENAEDYHGVESDFVDYEEPNIFKEGDIVTEQLSMRCKGASSYTLNPTRKLKFLSKIQEREDSKYIHSTYKDNRFLAKNVIKEIEIRGAQDARYKAIYMDGKYMADGESAIFTNWSIADFQPEKSQCKKEVYSMDWGFSNDPTTLERSRYYDSKLYVKELFRAAKLTTHEIAFNISAYVPHGSIIIVDNSEPRLLAELRILLKGTNIQLLKTKKGKGSILTGIKQLQSIPIVIDSSSPFLIEEFELYAWKKISGVLTNTPEDKNNHGIDAIRYGHSYLH